MEIYLIRHTRPEISKGLIYGHLDVPLAVTFSEERAEVLRQLPSTIQTVYSSPLQRCTQLADCITADYITDEALKELHFGDWEGLTWDTVNRQDSETWMADFVHRAPPGGETMLQLQTRVFRFIETLLRQPQQSTALVTHGGVIRVLLAHYRAVPLKDAFTIPVGMGEVFRLTVSSL